MTFEEYLDQGGDREEKLVVIYQHNPDMLSEQSRGIFNILFDEWDKLEPVRKALKKQFPGLYEAVEAWEDGRIKKSLQKAEADWI